MEPDRYGAGRKAAITFAVNDWQFGMHLIPPLSVEPRPRQLELRVQGDDAPTSLALRGSILKRDHIGDCTFGIGDHRPSDSRDLLCPQPGLQREHEHDPIAERIAPGIEFGQDGPNLLVGEYLCLFTKWHRTYMKVIRI